MKYAYIIASDYGFSLSCSFCLREFLETLIRVSNYLFHKILSPCCVITENSEFCSLFLSSFSCPLCGEVHPFLQEVRKDREVISYKVMCDNFRPWRGTVLFFPSDRNLSIEIYHGDSEC